MPKTNETPFSKFSEICILLEGVPRKKAKIQIITDLLRSLNVEEIPYTVRFLLGKPTIQGADGRLEIGPSTLMNISHEKFKQKSLIGGTLSIIEVASIFDKIASLTGSGSKKAKERLLRGLLNQATDIERNYIYRLISREMRIGVEEGTMLESLAKLSGQPIEQMRRYFMLSHDIGELAKTSIIASHRLKTIVVTPFKPIRPMMAEMAYNVQDALEAHGGESIFEYKFDGVRVQIHKLEDKIRIYSRGLLDVTENVPDIVKRIGRVKEKSVILDGELIAFNKEGKPLPFQDLMKRFKRGKSSKKVISEIPIRPYIFDILYLNGEELLNKTYKERKRILEIVICEDMLTPTLISKESQNIEKFMCKAIREGHEGLMAKAPYDLYHIGARGKSWLKLKPAETLDLVVIAADWGHGRRWSWLSNYHLASPSNETGEFLMVGKTFKGLTDEEFEKMTKKLLSIKIHEENYTVYVKPEIVVEVAFNEIQRSPRYSSGYALRFARIERIREDKKPNETDTLSKIRLLYDRQFKFKGKLDVAAL